MPGAMPWTWMKTRWPETTATITSGRMTMWSAKKRYSVLMVTSGPPRITSSSH